MTFMANLRKGRSKGRPGQKGGATQTAWRDDPIILERIGVGMSAWLEHKGDIGCLEHVNEWMAEAYPDEPPIALSTIKLDRKRGMDLRREQAGDMAEKHLAEIDHAIDEAWRAFRDAKSQSLNRSAFISAVKSLIELKAKIDRTLSPDGQVNVHMQQGLTAVGEVLERAMIDAKLTPAQREAVMAALAKALRD